MRVRTRPQSGSIWCRFRCNIDGTYVKTAYDRYIDTDRDEERKLEIIYMLRDLDYLLVDTEMDISFTGAAPQLHIDRNTDKRRI